jgi:hypothetical protein
MWTVKANVIPVKTGAAGIISESLKQWLRNITGNHEDEELQKPAILITAHKLREVLM